MRGRGVGSADTTPNRMSRTHNSRPASSRGVGSPTPPPKPEPTEMVRSAKPLLPALTFASWPAIAQQWTPQQRAACEPDAMRLCQQYVSDIGRVRACMSHYRRYLSPACRAEFGGGAKK